MHFGHANSLRQAKEMGDYLIVGVHSDGAFVANACVVSCLLSRSRPTDRLSRVDDLMRCTALHCTVPTLPDLAHSLAVSLWKR